MSNNDIIYDGKSGRRDRMSAGTKVTVGVRNNDVEFALRKWKNAVARNGNLSKAKERAEGYKSKSKREKEEKKQNTINSRRNARKNNY